MCEIQLLLSWEGQKGGEVFLTANGDVVLIAVDEVKMMVAIGMHWWKFVDLLEPLDKSIVSEPINWELLSMLPFVNNLQTVFFQICLRFYLHS